MTRFPLIGIDPTDPYGRIMSELFARNKLPYDITIRARFGNTVVSLVQAALGIAVIDQFSVAHGGVPGIRLLEIPSRRASRPSSPSSAARRCRPMRRISSRPCAPRWRPRAMRPARGREEITSG